MRGGRNLLGGGRARTLVLPGAVTDYASTPDSVANSITGDIDIVLVMSLADWTPAAANYILTKFQVAGQISYLVSIGTTGLVVFEWSVLGTIVASATSTEPAGITDGAFATIRVTHDVDNGAVGNDVTFYVNGVQLGGVVTGVGVTSHFDSTSNLTISGFGNGANGPMTGSVSYAEIRSGIGGAAVVIFDPRATRRGATTFISPTGELWTMNGSAALR